MSASSRRCPAREPNRTLQTAPSVIVSWMERSNRCPGSGLGKEGLERSGSSNGLWEGAMVGALRKQSASEWRGRSNGFRGEVGVERLERSNGVEVGMARLERRGWSGAMVGVEEAEVGAERKQQWHLQGGWSGEEAERRGAQLNVLTPPPFSPWPHRWRRGLLMNIFLRWRP